VSDMTPKTEASQSLRSLLTERTSDEGTRDRVLVDVAFQRCLRSQPPVEEACPELSTLDADALDAYVMARGEPARVPGSLRDRANALQGLGELLTSGPDLRDSALAERVMASAEALPRRTGSETAISRRFTLPSGWRDLVSMAAVLVLGVSLLWPLLGATNHYAKRSQCSANLGIAAAGLGMYANDFAGALPWVTAGVGSRPWWDVQPTQAVSNASNVYVLPRLSYLSLASLACPGNPAAPRGECPTGHVDWGNLGEVSYSFQIMAGPALRVLADGPRRVLLADASPVVRWASAGLPADPEQNSANHERAGQFVLFSDGSAEWAYRPVLGGGAEGSGDNIWLPKFVTDRAVLNAAPLRGHEAPLSPNDHFVGP